MHQTNIHQIEKSGDEGWKGMDENAGDAIYQEMKKQNAETDFWPVCPDLKNGRRNRGIYSMEHSLGCVVGQF